MDTNDFFRQATLRICGSLDNQMILKRTRKYLKQFFPVDAIVMCVYDPTDRSFVNVVSDAEPDFPQSGERIVISPEAAREVEQVGKCMAFLRINNRPNQGLVSRHIWEALGKIDVSTMVMRLSLDNQGIGLISVTTKGFDRYTKEDGSRFSLLHEPFAVSMANALQHRELLRLQELLQDDNRYLKRQLHRLAGNEIVGANLGLRNVMELVHQVAPLPSQVLLLGETGVGKEVIANAIHYASARAHGPFIKVNCGAMPDNLLDSELFGHEKGAFTGATTLKRGRFERAHQGTLFLDEIGELPPHAQVRLLRVLQAGEIERVGGSETLKLDVRIIAATHRNLEEMVRRGQFREDLWFRLNVFPITIPPLRERLADIPSLLQHFIEKKAREMNFSQIPLPLPGTVEKLQTLPWHGNIRELENMVERAMILNLTAPDRSRLCFDGLEPDLPPAPAAPQPPREPDHLTLLRLDQVMADHIRRVLEHTGGKIQGPDGAAAVLGLHPSTLRHRLKKLDIPYGRGSASPAAPGKPVEKLSHSRYE